MLEAVGPEAVRLRAIELQRMDPAIDGVILSPHEPDDLLAQIRCPIHLLAAKAELDGAMDAQDVARFVSHAPQCSHCVVEGAGQGIHEERPDEYVQALQQFTSAVLAQGVRA